VRGEHLVARKQDKKARRKADVDKPGGIAAELEPL
jgi:hypothetical protein